MLITRNNFQTFLKFKEFLFSKYFQLERIFCQWGDLVGPDAWIISCASSLIRGVLDYHCPPKLQFLLNILSFETRSSDKIFPQNSFFRVRQCLSITKDICGRFLHHSTDPQVRVSHPSGVMSVGIHFSMICHQAQLCLPSTGSRVVLLSTCWFALFLH